MENVFVFVVEVLFVSCNTVTRSNYKPEDLIFTKEDFNRRPKSILNSKDIEKDIDILIYALEKGYGAKGYLPDNQLEKAILSLKEIKKHDSLTEQKFCNMVGDILWDIQDGHLSVKSRGQYCGKQNEWKNRKGNVGKNFALNKIKKNKRPWHVEKRKIKGKTIGLVSIAYYPNHKDKVWNGFLKESKKLFNLDAIIIDLRGNQGGDDTMGFELAYFMQDRQIKPGWDKTIDKLSPETIALSFNNFTIKKLWYEKNKKPVPKYVLDYLEKRKELLIDIKNGKYPENEIYTWDQSKYPLGEKLYKGKVIILSDRECVSSGESSMEALAKHPHAKIYGENTGGKYHFGNVATLALPNSKLTIGIASKYNAYKDGKNIDKVGLSPDVKVPMGMDALEFAIKDLIK